MTYNSPVQTYSVTKSKNFFGQPCYDTSFIIYHHNFITKTMWRLDVHFCYTYRQKWMHECLKAIFWHLPCMLPIRKTQLKMYFVPAAHSTSVDWLRDRSCPGWLCSVCPGQWSWQVRVVTLSEVAPSCKARWERLWPAGSAAVVTVRYRPVAAVVGVARRGGAGARSWSATGVAAMASSLLRADGEQQWRLGVPVRHTAHWSRAGPNNYWDLEAGRH